jgi:hypothetical protein
LEALIAIIPQMECILADRIQVQTAAKIVVKMIAEIAATTQNPGT